MLAIIDLTRLTALTAKDGKGVRGLSSLVILSRIMHALEPDTELHELWKYFGMIARTGTGG